ncbi:hypothetical protein CRYUN_Cryun38cG0057200 [Craigia yunnanensis]
MLLSIMKFTFAADMITPAQSISDGETLVSSSESFELGLFSPGNSKNRFLGIWYKNIPGPILWIANRNSPITDVNGLLIISGDGKLILLDGRNNTIWSSIVPRKAEAPVAQLLDSGNFVLKQNLSLKSETYPWQSFDHPSDTLLPGMKLGKNLKTGLEWNLSSWKIACDPSSGNFTYRLDIHGLPYLVISNGLAKMLRTGPWNGLFFGGVPTVPNLIFEPILRLVWNGRSSEWTVVYTEPRNKCNHYGQCGVNGICSISCSGTATCECLKGFISELLGGQHIESHHNWSKRCVKKGPSDCQNGEGFVKLDGIKLPDLIDFSLNESMNLKECEVNCLKNCSCKGYARANLSRPDSGCPMWFGDLIDVSKESGEIKGLDIYKRVPSSELGLVYNSNDKKRKKIIMVISTVPGLIILTMLLCFLKKQWNKGQKSRKENAKVHLFGLATISIATNNFFQENLIGAGGFGFVYKGILPTGQEIAVKRLSKSSGQDNNREVLLAWQKRFDIVIQIVRGLLYLHQDSKLHILQRDLKASNILLDSDLNPKISDFGLARIFEGEDKVSETKRVVGTFGYMSPEYAVKGLFSVKSDVFSLGRALELVDTCLKDSILESQVLRCIQVALLCVQNFPEDRPTMSSVNFMLAKEEAILPHLREPGFFTEKSSNADIASRNAELPTVNVVTITMLGGR